jgi:hypothetical protein
VCRADGAQHHEQRAVDDQPTEASGSSTLLAKCYRVETGAAGNFYDQYLWITWAPFLVTSWHELLTAAYVATAVTGPGIRPRKLLPQVVSGNGDVR